jgi:hypothetical protein
MAKLTKDFVLEEFANYYGRRSRLIGDCEAEPEITRDIIMRLEDLRKMAVQVDLGADYLALMDELILELAVIAAKEYEREYYGEDDRPKRGGNRARKPTRKVGKGASHEQGRRNSSKKGG